MESTLKRCPLEFLEVAVRLADEVRPIVDRYFRANPETEQKANRTPVTVADRLVELCLREGIEESYPSHGIVGEEFGTSNAEAEFVWVLDPIDGTHAFICGLPLFGTLISLTHEGRPLLGIMDQAITAERWIGAAGLRATLNDLEVTVRSCSALEDALVCMPSPDYFRGPDIPPFEAMREAVKYVRFGTSCYGYGLLASGHVDLVMDASLNPYDYMAQVSIVESAGGVMTDWEGRRLSLELGATRVIAAGDPALHAKALDVLAC